MYEMRAEATADRGELIWHVITKGTPASPLCGVRRDLHAVAPELEAAVERYCASCMTAFSTALQATTLKGSTGA
ncbi:hypothetical protein J7E88_10010 [Streptomyces sp. ISL-10]|uniref:hypothetical protein n=1 Tax=Streptomyces sp. ISL-10 TaxID=2819172 RepID=UPI001BE96932|nr:hypothetical protein [Streptomyces sp. ISL-10]MBT2365644.1 hypothetical protein [Streptomyces sp. ISL-10]